MGPEAGADMNLVLDCDTSCGTVDKGGVNNKDVGVYLCVCMCMCTCVYRW